MWVIFLLAAISIALCCLLVAYVANKVFIKIREDRLTSDKKLKEMLEDKENNENE